LSKECEIFREFYKDYNSDSDFEQRDGKSQCPKLVSILKRREKPFPIIAEEHPTVYELGIKNYSSEQALDDRRSMGA
jgi:hypothetical protein